MRLPIVDVAEFVAELNRVDGDHGLHILFSGHDGAKDGTKDAGEDHQLAE